MQPVITGLGLVTPLGGSAAATWRALLDGQHISDHARLESIPGACRIAALADAAAREAVAQAGWTSRILADPDTAMVVGTSKGDVLGGGAKDVPYPYSIFHFPLSLQVGGPRTTLSAACASGLHALIHAALLLRGGGARRVLVIGAEASVDPLFIGSFQRLGVLASSAAGCRPFDRQRKGFLMSEAAAAVCLQRASDVEGRGMAAIEGFALGADAHHLTSGDPHAEVLRRLIARMAAGGAMDLVHAHGTATIYNDAAELEAIEATIADESAVLYSHKGALGHSLGASGLVSIVLNCLSHRHNLVPPNVQTRDPMPTRLVLSRNAVERPIRRSLALAAGFGGAIAAVGLRSLA